MESVIIDKKSGEVKKIIKEKKPCVEVPQKRLGNDKLKDWLSF